MTFVLSPQTVGIMNLCKSVWRSAERAFLRIACEIKRQKQGLGFEMNAWSIGVTRVYQGLQRIT